MCILYLIFIGIKQSIYQHKANNKRRKNNNEKEKKKTNNYRKYIVCLLNEKRIHTKLITQFHSINWNNKFIVIINIFSHIDCFEWKKMWFHSFELFSFWLCLWKSVILGHQIGYKLFSKFSIWKLTDLQSQLTLEYWLTGDLWSHFLPQGTECNA